MLVMEIYTSTLKMVNKTKKSRFRKSSWVDTPLNSIKGPTWLVRLTKSTITMIKCYEDDHLQTSVFHHNKIIYIGPVAKRVGWAGAVKFLVAAVSQTSTIRQKGSPVCYLLNNEY